MKKIILAGIIPSLLLAVSAIDACFADGWQGSGNYGSATSGGVGGGNGNYDTSTAWVHFKYVGGSDMQGRSIWIVPQYTANLTQSFSAKLPNVDGKCAKQDVGFWTLARISKPKAGLGPLKPVNSSDVGDYREEGLDRNPDKTYYYNGIEATYLKRWADYYNKNTYINGSGEYMIYRNMKGEGWSIFDTLSYNNATDYYAVKKPGGATAQQVLYYGTGGNDDQFGSIEGKIHKMYELDEVANGMADVYKSYRAYLVASKTKTQDQVNGMSDTDIDALMRNADGSGNGTYAFCSYENVLKKEASLDTKSQIKIYDNNAEKRSNLSGWDTETSNDSVYEFDTSGSFKLNFNFAYQRSANDFDTNAVSKGSSISVYRADANGNNMVELYSKTVSTPAFKKGVTTLNDQHTDSTTTSFEGLEANTVYMFCAYIKHPETVTITNDVQTTSGQGDSEACVKAKYKPITATIDSDTRASLDGKNYDSGADTSKTYPDANNYITVKAGPKTVTWSHYLGWTSRSDGKTGNVLAKTYGLNGAKALDNALAVGKYNNSHTFNLNKNDDGYPSTSGNNNTSEAGVFPGEARDDISQSLKHPSKVEVTSGDAATGSSGESSSVKLRLKADNIQCGLDKDHLYPIGADAPNDYRWLSIRRSDGVKATVGDDLADSDNLWLRDNDEISISQTACFGSQIGVDASNKGSDRFSSNLWDNRESDKVHNRQFTLVSGFSDTFFATNSASGVSSHTDRSLRASEIGITIFSKVSTPQRRITNNYKIVANNGGASVSEYLGRSLDTTFSKPGPDGGTSGAAVTVSVKIPYNYYLTVDPGGSETLDGASNANFAVTIKNNGRVNKQLCSGRNIGSNCAAYPTRTKKTTANMVVFALDSSFDVSALSSHSDFTIGGNMSSVDNIKSVIGQRLGSYNPQSLKEAQNGFSNTVISGSGTKTLRANSIDYSSYPVGTKICAATAVYPSDSHDTGISTGPNAYVIDSAEQSNALREDGQKTRYNVTCRTVAKHQTMSVEGNGLATIGDINTNSTVYKGRVFRSWSEYQIVSGTSNAGSGAVTAYALGNAATDPYATKDNIDQYSVKSGSFLYPQSLGNIKQVGLLGSNSKDEATTNWGYAEKLKNTIIDKYGNLSDALPDEYYYRSYSNGNVEIAPPSLEDRRNKTVIIKTTGKATITANSKLDDSNVWGNPKQIIIIANSIDIAGDVEKVNAWLIVDGGEFNTCAGNLPNYKKPGTNEGDGNQHLLDNCNRPLFINGAVIVDGTVTLPRTYGGGSVVNTDGSITKDERTYVQRAEIFNYDPRVVKWAYEESKKNPQLVTTYTESLAPRL